MGNFFITLSCLIAKLCFVIIGGFLSVSIANIISGSPVLLILLLLVKIILGCFSLGVLFWASLVRFATNDPSQSKFMKMLFLKLEQVNAQG